MTQATSFPQVHLSETGRVCIDQKGISLAAKDTLKKIKEYLEEGKEFEIETSDVSLGKIASKMQSLYENNFYTGIWGIARRVRDFFISFFKKTERQEISEFVNGLQKVSLFQNRYPTNFFNKKLLDLSPIIKKIESDEQSQALIKEFTSHDFFNAFDPLFQMKEMKGLLDTFLSELLDTFSADSPEKKFLISSKFPEKMEIPLESDPIYPFLLLRKIQNSPEWALLGDKKIPIEHKKEQASAYILSLRLDCEKFINACKKFQKKKSEQFDKILEGIADPNERNKKFVKFQNLLKRVEEGVALAGKLMHYDLLPNSLLEFQKIATKDKRLSTEEMQTLIAELNSFHLARVRIYIDQRDYGAAMLAACKFCRLESFKLKKSDEKLLHTLIQMLIEKKDKPAFAKLPVEFFEMAFAFGTQIWDQDGGKLYEAALNLCIEQEHFKLSPKKIMNHKVEARKEYFKKAERLAYAAKFIRDNDYKSALQRLSDVELNASDAFTEKNFATLRKLIVHCLEKTKFSEALSLGLNVILKDKGKLFDECVEACIKEKHFYVLPKFFEKLMDKAVAQDYYKKLYNAAFQAGPSHYLDACKFAIKIENGDLRQSCYKQILINCPRDEKGNHNQAFIDAMVQIVPDKIVKALMLLIEDEKEPAKA